METPAIEIAETKYTLAVPKLRDWHKILSVIDRDAWRIIADARQLIDDATQKEEAAQSEGREAQRVKLREGAALLRTKATQSLFPLLVSAPLVLSAFCVGCLRTEDGERVTESQIDDLDPEDALAIIAKAISGGLFSRLVETAKNVGGALAAARLKSASSEAG